MVRNQLEEVVVVVSELLTTSLRNWWRFRIRERRSVTGGGL